MNPPSWPHPLVVNAWRYEHFPALVWEETTWTWRDFARTVWTLARDLREQHEIRAGMTVVVEGRFLPHTVFLIHALWWLRAVPLVLNPAWNREERNQALSGILIHATLDPADWEIPSRPRVLHPEGGNGGSRFPWLYGQDGASVIFTSGSQGVPKAILHSWQNHRAQALASAIHLGHRRGDRWLLVLPLFHVGGLAVLSRALFTAGCVVMESFDPPRTARSLTGVEFASLVPTMLYRVLEHFRGPRGHLRGVLLGGGPARYPLVQEALERGLPVLRTYGMTETTSQVSTVLPENPAASLRGSGVPLPAVEVQVVREDGRVAGREEEGEIRIRGETVAFPLRMDLGVRRWSGGWFYTGDIGMWNPYGELVVLGRKDDTVITGGEKVHPSEVEAVLARHPAVRDVVVMGVEDPEWGQRLVAFVACPRPCTEEELRQFVRDRLAGYKTPKDIVVVDRLPRNALGKVSRKDLLRLWRDWRGKATE